MANPSVLYFGLYDPDYARNRVIINGLKRNGVNVFECREKPARLALFKLALHYLKLKSKFDVVIVGFPGQEVMFLAKLIIRKPIVFDAFTSHYGGYILDRKRWSKNSCRAKYFRFLDTWSCRLADIVLLDTQAHIDFFVNEFKLSTQKFRRIWIGANDDVFKPVEDLPLDSEFKVLFFGTFIPLQGTEYIVKAAKILESHKDIKFYLIGKGQDKPKALELADKLGLKNIVFMDMLRHEELVKELPSSQVVLGIFGDTPKTSLVIPNKIFEALAAQKAVITADTPAIRELLSDQDVLMVKAADPQSIADAVLTLKSDSNKRIALAQHGYDTFVSCAATVVIGKEVKQIISSIYGKEI